MLGHTLLSLFLQVAGSAGEPETVIRAGRLIDPHTGREYRNQEILVRGQTIADVGPHVTAKPNARRVDLGGATVLPGLMDAHTHLTIRIRPERDGGEYLILNMFDPPGYRAIQGAAHAREMLEAGFTTVRDVGNAGDYLDLRRAVNAGLVPGPNILAAGRIIAPYGGQHYIRDFRNDERRNADPEY